MSEENLDDWIIIEEEIINLEDWEIVEWKVTKQPPKTSWLIDSLIGITTMVVLATELALK